MHCVRPQRVLTDTRPEVQVALERLAGFEARRRALEAQLEAGPLDPNTARELEFRIRLLARAAFSAYLDLRRELGPEAARAALDALGGGAR